MTPFLPPLPTPLSFEDEGAAALVHRLSFDTRFPWLAGLHTPDEDAWFYKDHVFRTCAVWGIHHGTDLPAVNSAMWILPQLVPGRGLQMKRRRQGKKNLAAQEVTWEGMGLVRSFRPAQWLVGYEWSGVTRERPLWLSAAVCYDSTDLGLAADLRDRSDVFAIPALNKDVGTFDQMALALHYHMFQIVRHQRPWHRIGFEI